MAAVLAQLQLVESEAGPVMDASTAWFAFGLTVVVQVGSVAFFLGSTNQKLRDLKERLDGHIGMPVRRAHSDKESQ